MVDLAFTLTGLTLPHGHRQPLAAALERELPWLPQTPGAGMHRLNLSQGGDGQALLSQRTRLRRQGQLLLAAVVFFGLATILFGVARSFWLVMLALLLIGAAAGGLDAGALAALSRYGRALGHAVQLRDDVLGVFGDPSETGKPAGDDIREGKRTVLIAHALDRADALGRAEVSAAHAA